MHVLFEEAGKFHTARILTETPAGAQAEMDSGKRIKLKSAQMLLRFTQPEPATLMAAAQKTASEIELDLAWEFAPEDEFDFLDLAREYFSAQPSLEQQAGTLIALFEAPHYFRRLGKGRFKKAPMQIVQQALAAIEKKKALEAQIQTWADALAQGQCPEPVAQQLYKILFKPDKNAPEYKAVVLAARATQASPLALLQNAGAITSPYQFHWQRFLFEQFPQGTHQPALEPAALNEELPQATAQAFSIDDASTTEIDDALSVQGLGSPLITVGIHIAAPGLAITPDSALAALARTRLSTVYMPGYKLTMLPGSAVQHYTLQEGRFCPALSLYLSLDAETLEVRDTQSKIEQVFIKANLRHEHLEGLVSPESLSANDGAFPFQAELGFLYRWAQHLKTQREVARGKPENFHRPDYNFKLERADSSVAPQGDETVRITTRQRGLPLDLIVSEAMIMVNSTWGHMLHEHGVPGIYRSQASLAPGIKVRMGTHAAPHAGLGVKSYAWSTSPLRRYVDLVNQWQIITCLRHGKTAALVAPFKPKDAQLLSIVASFDASYTAYNGFQNNIERYWTLRYLAQNQITELTATLLKDNLVRAEELPLVLTVTGAPNLLRGTRLRVKLSHVDLLTLEAQASFVASLDTTTPEVNEEDEDEAATSAAPITIAVELDEAPSPSA